MTGYRPAATIRRRGVSTLEAVLVVILLAVAVPPALRLMDDIAAARVDAVNASRAACLAGAVLDTVLADAAAFDAGLAATPVTDDPLYVNAAGTGLRARLALVSQPYEAVGLTYTVTVGPAVAADLTATGFTALDLFRVVTVTVEFPSGRGGRIATPVSVVVYGGPA